MQCGNIKIVTRIIPKSNVKTYFYIVDTITDELR